MSYGPRGTVPARSRRPTADALTRRYRVRRRKPAGFLGGDDPLLIAGPQWAPDLLANHVGESGLGEESAHIAPAWLLTQDGVTGPVITRSACRAERSQDRAGGNELCAAYI